jgi:hypothetical protein
MYFDFLYNFGLKRFLFQEEFSEYFKCAMSSRDVPVILVCLTSKICEISRQNIENSSSIKSHENYSSVNQVSPCIKTDRRTGRHTGGHTHGKKANSRFTPFCKFAQKILPLFRLMDVTFFFVILIFCIYVFCFLNDVVALRFKYLLLKS